MTFALSSQPPLALGPCWVAKQCKRSQWSAKIIDVQCTLYMYTNVHGHNTMNCRWYRYFNKVGTLLGCYGLGLKHVSWVMTLKERWRLTSFQKNWYAAIFRLSSHFIDYNCIGLLDPKNSNECCNDPNDQNFDKTEHKMWYQYIINFGHN